jgi:hypothetical protein
MEETSQIDVDAPNDNEKSVIVAAQNLLRSETTLQHRLSGQKSTTMREICQEITRLEENSTDRG